MQPTDNTRQTLAININGIVQGVGFRPFVYKLATSMGLYGSVANAGDGVRIIATGSSSSLHSFTRKLQEKAPPMASITSFTTEECSIPTATEGFSIIHSHRSHQASVPITPDIAVCSDCLQEIRSPGNPRHGYPFTNCTNCGPRFTIVERVPYDRPHTSMRHFPMCPQCQQEYDDPLDRRFHAQPNACPICGPQLSWHDASGILLDTTNCIEAAALALADGQVVAIKGLGGFHLAADASSPEAVHRLRQRKNRPEKPLAVMVRDLAMASRYCDVDEIERDLLLSPQQPIVLLRQKTAGNLAPNLAPGLGVLGVMIAYTPLHALLLDTPLGPDALVMTSGNLTDEPICTDNEEALERLQSLADFFLLHNRDIVTRVDDSVARVMGKKVRLLRRGRGYSPVPMPILATADILACGAEMKNTFCIVRNNEAYVGQHIGELSNPDCLDFYSESIAHLQTILECHPHAVACDRHPDYPSTRFARKLQGELTPVQHHHAHAAAVMAEHRLDGEVISVILDGTGYGDDSTVFGGEIYLANRNSYRRLGRLAHLPLPGGDQAVREPWRMATALLFQAGLLSRDIRNNLPSELSSVPVEKIELLVQMLSKHIHSPLTSSCGRLFDAVAAMLGICHEASFEGQGAMLLEQAAQLHLNRGSSAFAPDEEKYRPTVDVHDGLRVLNSLPLAQWIRGDLQQGVSLEQIAYSFHRWLIRGITLLVERVQRQYMVNTTVLSGGCMQNKILLEGLEQTLRKAGFAVYSGELIPVNDGGIALGQAYIAGAPRNESLRPSLTT